MSHTESAESLQDGPRFQPDALIAALAPLRVADCAVATKAAAAYRDFYSLNIDGVRHVVGWLSAVPTPSPMRVCAHLFIPQNAVATVFLCHGYYDHTGLYGHLIRYLTSRGLAVVALDLPGHGLSDGKRASIDSFSTYVDAYALCKDTLSSTEWLSVLPGVRHLAGQSLGGAVVMSLVDRLAEAGQDPYPHEAVLFAPLIRPWGWRVNRWVFEVARRTVEERPRKIANNADNPEFIAFQARDPLQAMVLPVRWVEAMVEWMAPFLAGPVRKTRFKLVQGHADRTVDFRFNLREIERRFPGTDMLHIPEARHHLVNESPDIRQRMWDWLDSECQWS